MNFQLIFFMDQVACLLLLDIHVISNQSKMAFLKAPYQFYSEIKIHHHFLYWMKCVYMSLCAKQIILNTSQWLGITYVYRFHNCNGKSNSCMSVCGVSLSFILKRYSAGTLQFGLQSGSRYFFIRAYHNLGSSLMTTASCFIPYFLKFFAMATFCFDKKYVW